MSLSDAMPLDRPQDLARRFADLQRQIRQLTAATHITSSALGNNLLKEPVVPNVARTSSSGFGLTTGVVEKAGLDLTVPSGCTRLLAVVSGRVYTVNANTTGGGDGAGLDAVYVLVALGSQSSVASPVGVSGNNGFATATSSEAFVLTGLTPGATIRLGVHAASAYKTVPANPDSYASVNAALTWLR